MFGHTNEPFTLERDVTAVIIPAGEALTLARRYARVYYAGTWRKLHRLC